ncbi:uncharacterized protein LOC117180571 [Belonocnema kinseyi]|uniref:uncharacterized protein LOC117180571 n=1 Tax=Belonocnema kinseyi TaxID=2817044 RepID=UPI00143CEC73|nr:uncharacterized protein LOC117180571 [Belonocnema kinseyi]
MKWLAKNLLLTIAFYFNFRGDPLDLNPNEMTCYMTYNGQDLKVTRVPHEEVPLKVELLPHNMSNPKQSYVKSYDVRKIYVHFGGLYFVMHVRHKVKGKEHIAYIGADLDLEGPNRPPEIYSGSNSG